MMEDRSSPPATTSYYRPPLGVRHLASVSARNVVPPGGPPKRLAGVGVFFTLHECSSAPSDDANGVVSGSASSGRDYGHGTRDMGHGTRGALYTSEVVRDTLNPDWAPLDEALIDAAASARTSSGKTPEEGLPRRRRNSTRETPKPGRRRFVSVASRRKHRV